MHRRPVYIYLLNVPSFSSRYFNKIKRRSRLGRLLALSLEILNLSDKALCIGILNVDTIWGKTIEVVEAIARRKVDLRWFEETRWELDGVRKIDGKD